MNSIFCSILLFGYASRIRPWASRFDMTADPCRLPEIVRTTEPLCGPGCRCGRDGLISKAGLRSPADDWEWADSH